MPSPFPGMDPYLEGSEWTGVHTELGSEIARQLAPKLRPKYIVRTTRRFVTETLTDVAVATANIYPDVSVFDATRPGSLSQPVAAVTAPLEMATVMPAQVPHVSVEIRDVANHELVTAIELLSPTNKRGDGYQEYLNRRRQLLYSSAHLIEIDLLRTGQRVPMQQPLPPAAYFVFLSRAERRPIIEVWPIQLNMPLPVIPAPLRADDPDVTLDLQEALNTVYDALGYDLSVDYTRPPEVPLQGEAAEWAVQLLQTAGFRPANIEN